MKGVIRTCDVCGVSCSGDDAWASHLAGKNHAKAVKRRAAAEAGDDDEGGSAAVPSVAAASKNKITFVGEDAEIRYADQVISKELNASVVECVGELKRFQDRAYFKDPVKAKMRRRLVFGLSRWRRRCSSSAPRLWWWRRTSNASSRRGSGRCRLVHHRGREAKRNPARLRVDSQQAGTDCREAHAHQRGGRVGPQRSRRSVQGDAPGPRRRDARRSETERAGGERGGGERCGGERGGGERGGGERRRRRRRARAPPTSRGSTRPRRRSFPRLRRRDATGSREKSPG